MTNQRKKLPSQSPGADDARPDDEEYISAALACRMVGKDAASLIAMGHLDDFPLPVSARLSRPDLLFWRRREVENWLERSNWPPF